MKQQIPYQRELVDNFMDVYNLWQMTRILDVRRRAYELREEIREKWPIITCLPDVPRITKEEVIHESETVPED